MDYILREQNLCRLNGFEKLSSNYLIFTFNSNTIYLSSVTKKGQDTNSKFYTENRTVITDEKIITELKKRNISYLSFTYYISFYESEPFCFSILSDKEYYKKFAKELLMKANQDDSYKRTDDKHWVNFIQINDIYISNKKTVIFSISDKAYTNYIAPIITEYLSNNHITWTDTLNKSEVAGVREMLSNIVPFIKRQNFALYNFYFNIIFNLNLFSINVTATFLHIERTLEDLS